MPRIEPVKRDEVDPQYYPLYDEMTSGGRGVVSGPYRVLMHTPDVALPWRRWIEDNLRGGLKMPLSLMELAILVTAREERCEYVWGAHQRAAERAGSRPEAVAVVRREAPTSQLNAEEAEIVQFAEQVNRKQVDDGAFDRLKARWGENDVIRLTAIIGCYRLIATLLAAFDITPESEGQANTFPKG